MNQLSLKSLNPKKLKKKTLTYCTTPLQLSLTINQLRPLHRSPLNPTAISTSYSSISSHLLRLRRNSTLCFAGTSRNCS